MIGPDGATHIETDRFCYRNLEEHSKSKSIQFSTSLILDPSNLSYGSLIPGSAAFNYNKDNEKGTTWATVAGTNAQGGDPLIIHDLLNSDDISKLNRNRETIQTREDGKHSHVRLYLPIADMQQIWKAMQSSSQSEFEQQVDLVLKKGKELKAKELSAKATANQPADGSNVESETVADEANPPPFVNSEAQVIAESVFGESWKGEAVVAENENGECYLIHRGEWVNPFGDKVTGTGFVKLKEVNVYKGVGDIDKGEVNITFDPNNQNLSFDIIKDGSRLSQTQSIESFFKEAIMGVNFGYGNRPGVRIVNIQVETFIAATVLEVVSSLSVIPGCGLWAGDDRNFDELGSYRTFHTIKILFENGKVTIIDEMKATGITYKLDSLGQPIETGQAPGETLQSTFEKIYSHEHQREIYVLHMEGNEHNPLTPSPGITYETNMQFDLDGQCLGGKTKHDRFPSHQIWLNGKSVYLFREYSYSPWWLPQSIQPALLLPVCPSEKATILKAL